MRLYRNIKTKKFYIWQLSLAFRKRKFKKSLKKLIHFPFLNLIFLKYKQKSKIFLVCNKNNFYIKYLGQCIIQVSFT